MKRNLASDAIFVVITVIVLVGLILLAIFYNGEGSSLFKNSKTSKEEHKTTTVDTPQHVNEVDENQQEKSEQSETSSSEADHNQESNEELEKMIRDFVTKWVEDPLNINEFADVVTDHVLEDLNVLLETSAEQTGQEKEIKEIELSHAPDAQGSNGFTYSAFTVVDTYDVNHNQETSRKGKLFYVTVEQAGDGWVITRFSDTLNLDAVIK